MADIEVLVVDDQAMIRSGIRGLLELAEGITVVGEAADGRHAVSMTRTLLPDVVLLDLQMPVMGGLEALTELRADERTAHVAVLVLTTFDMDENVLAALQGGANGFLGKAADHDELVASVKAVAAGRSSLSATATDAVVSHLARTAARATPDAASAEDVRRLDGLTAREREVVALVSRGWSNADIAEHLFISSWTVKTHINRAMRKVRASDRAQLVIAGLRAGLLDPS